MHHVPVGGRALLREYWHIGATMIRFFSANEPIEMGEKSRLMALTHS